MKMKHIHSSQKKKSRDLVKKRFQKKKNNSPLNKTDINDNNKKDNKNTNFGEQIFYKHASKKE